ncbi:MAG: amidohydrolase [Saccharofermentans sp.]|nr:amidohydrolase [Saccharofermentans sp.]
MSKIRLFNAKILTMKDREAADGEIWIDGKKITYVGAPKNTDISFDREIDCAGDLLMPGLKNAHTHTAMTFGRSLADSASLDDWLHKHIFPIEAKLNEDNIYWFSQLGYAEYLANGVTACFDMYLKPDAQAKSAVDAGFRHVFCGAVNDFGGMDTLEDEYNRFNNYDELVSYQLGFHAEYTTSEGIMKQISEISHKYEAPVFAHVSETKREVDGCIDRYGMSPVKVFDKLGLYDFGGGGFHCVWFDDEDLDIYQKRGLSAAFNCCSNLKLASGAARVDRFITRGVNIAVGTDGAASNNALNMFREMFLLSTLPNLYVDGGAFVDPYEILKAGTVGGARMMGLDDCDILAEGKQADIIRIDMKHPVMRPVNNTVANIVYSGHPGIVKMTMIAGNILYENGEYSTIDLDKVIDTTDKMMDSLR